VGRANSGLIAVALGDASTLMAENFTNPWCRVAQVEFSINLEFNIINGEGLQASIVLHSKVGMTP
jgi:hypothetical protein